MAIAWFELISLLDRRGEVVFLNHGFASLDCDSDIELSAEDEPNRYPIQLYHRVACAIDWTGLDALEIGCGRGGGASYVMRRFKPRRLVGLDLAGRAIGFCRKHHLLPGLSFEQGDAQRLAFPDASFDVVLNVESSKSYPDRHAFFREVVRVLRPGGHFLFADYRGRAAASRLKRQLQALPLDILSIEDVSENVRLALERDDARKRRLIRRVVPLPLRSLARQFAFVRQGKNDEYSEFVRGDRVYLCAVLRKSELVAP